MMKLIEIYQQLFERKQVGELYHFTTVENINKILTTNKLQTSKSDRHDAVSLSRGYDYHGKERGSAYEHYGADVRITLNGDKLSDNYKIVPTLGGSYGSNTIDIAWKPEREERVFSDIVNLHKYIKRIDFVVDMTEYENDDEYGNLIDSTVERIRKLGYPSEVYHIKFPKS